VKAVRVSLSGSTRIDSHLYRYLSI
jgi:hypothetical protein